jgi:hypothetical protein
VPRCGVFRLVGQQLAAEPFGVPQVAGLEGLAGLGEQVGLGHDVPSVVPWVNPEKGLTLSSITNTSYGPTGSPP